MDGTLVYLRPLEVKDAEAKIRSLREHGPTPAPFGLNQIFEPEA